MSWVYVSGHSLWQFLQEINNISDLLALAKFGKNWTIDLKIMSRVIQNNHISYFPGKSGKILSLFTVDLEWFNFSSSESLDPDVCYLLQLPATALDHPPPFCLLPSLPDEQQPLYFYFRSFSYCYQITTPMAGMTQVGIAWYGTPEQVTGGKGRRKDGSRGWAEWDQKSWFWGEGAWELESRKEEEGRGRSCSELIFNELRVVVAVMEGTFSWNNTSYPWGKSSTTQVKGVPCMLHLAGGPLTRSHW